MSDQAAKETQLEIAHVLFIDIVGYSKLLTNEQRERVEELNAVVRSTDQFRSANEAGKLVRLTTGDGMALAFFTSPDAPARCALQIAETLRNRTDLPLRMGIHSGPVSGVTDVNDRSNIAGAGINMAQRVMDCGDAGHVLLSKRIADDLAQDRWWQPQLHDLGECEVKHDVKVQVVNLWNAEAGNSQTPSKLCAQKQRSRRRQWALLGSAAALLALAAGVFLLWHGRNRAAAITDRSVAVLPFENLSEDKENAYFAGGVQDEILNNLAKVADLKVISRTSVMKYKSGPERNLREIAKTLGVSHVVEGSVQRAGGRVRVVAQLIDARSDAHLWAEHYDRAFADIFAIQSEIAQQIAEQLQAKLSPAEKAAIAERPTTDPVAYALYTKAREIDIYGNWEGAENEKSAAQKVELLEKATQRDPNFALAYCALAKAQTNIGHNDLAKKAADAALRVRPDLGEAHLELARYYYYVLDLDRAREEVTSARRKLPNDSETLALAARIDRCQNRWDASLANLQKAKELDPRNSEVVWFLGRIYLEMRRYSEQEQLVTNEAASGRLEDPLAKIQLTEIKLAQGDPAGAQTVLEQVPLEFSPAGLVWNTRFRAAVYLRDYDAANRIISATPTNFDDSDFAFNGPSGWAYGQIARARGDKQRALAAFAAARKNVDTKWGDRPRADYLELVARLDAGLGRKEEAIREAREAVDLVPIAKDAYWGPKFVTGLALVYAWSGERDRALEQLETIATIPGEAPTYGDLRFNPCWDDLRGDPRFDKIVAAAKAANK